MASLDTTATPPTGTVVMTMQLIAYDTAAYDPATAVPGDPQAERHVTLLFAEPIALPLEAFDGLTGQQSADRWNAELAAFADRMQVNNAHRLLQRAIRPAKRTTPVVIP